MPGQSAHGRVPVKVAGSSSPASRSGRSVTAVLYSAELPASGATTRSVVQPTVASAARNRIILSIFESFCSPFHSVPDRGCPVTVKTRRYRWHRIGRSATCQADVPDHRTLRYRRRRLATETLLDHTPTFPEANAGHVGAGAGSR